MNHHALLLAFAGRDLVGHAPGREGVIHQLLLGLLVLRRVVEARGFQRVVALRVIRHEKEVRRIQRDGLAIQVEGFVKHLGLGELEEIGGVAPEDKHGRGQVVVVGRFLGVERDGLAVVLNGLCRVAIVPVEIGQIVPRRRILGIGGERLAPLLFGGRFLALIVEEAAVGQERLGVVRMGDQELLVSLANGIEPLLDAGAQADFLLLVLVALLNPVIHLLVGRVILRHELLELALHGVIGIRHGDRHAGLLLDEIADGRRRIRGEQRAEQADGEVVHRRTVGSKS